MLELRSVSKVYGALKAVNQVTLKIQDGEFFSLLGPSGCGKTTLLRMLSGIETPTSGEILQDGARIDTLPANRRQFNMVFQRYALFPHLNVWDNIAFGLRMKRVAPPEITSRVNEALSLVQMESFAKRAIATLSGGQQQRIALARAFVNRPKVLLLDEPLSALDLKLRQQMQIELIALQRRLKHTFILVTHDQEEALTLSDRIAVMKDGVVEQVGSAEEIYEHPRTAFVAQFIGSVNSIDGFLIRPEKLRLLKNRPDPSHKCVEGTLKEILYQGPVTQFLIAHREGNHPPLLVTQPNISVASRKDIDIGEKVFVSWLPEDCIAMDGAAVV